ncbi:hypothetical protein ASPACDRAFT_40281 [Aspergillus aculeatus ATCC 16872]|uniref:Amidohydrolase-related domain-containing protein n=1 Tax=Aspergillus aculeatus (strain ATCC 16872 / CBS 172.66 / WB 5094) TaxID=690307 RepID=A0A1L9X3E3_ASPA1|nr:uncharacterized protein ASPACDRAFT_40281 [Aspergillus aculeatus ATCC 16872]OJK02966.1 hypothetical protein ASPACDRAFT_40281 [Aspergillus aculeatus ATCC 16872]
MGMSRPCQIRLRCKRSYASTIVLPRPGPTLLPGFIDGTRSCVATDRAAAAVSGLWSDHRLRYDLEAQFVPELRRAAVEDPDAADFRTASQPATIAGDETTHALLARYPDLRSQSDIDAYLAARRRDADYIKLFHEDGVSLAVETPRAIPRSAATHRDRGARSRLSGAGTTVKVLKYFIDMLRLGVDGMSHTFCETRHLRRRHCNPTLSCLGSVTHEGHALQQRYAQDPRIQRVLAPPVKTAFCACMGLARPPCTVGYAYQTVRALKAAGVDIVVESDAHIPAVGTGYGRTLHQELGLLMSECGFTPAEALEAATATFARRLRLGD